MFNSVIASPMSLTAFLLCELSALVLGLLAALVFTRGEHHSGAYAQTLALLPAGQKVYLTFGNGEEQEGTVEAIDYLADVDENEQQPSVGYANYKVYISFEKKEGIRQGMLVTVDLPEPEAEPVEEVPADRGYQKIEEEGDEE